MQKHRKLTLDRVRRFVSEDGLYGRLYPEREPVQLEVWSAPDRVPLSEAMRAAYRPVEPGESFGPLWSTHWFRVHLRVPEAWQGREVHMLWDSNSEACVWRDGQPVRGLAGGRRPPPHPRYVVCEAARSGEEIALYVEMACNGLFGARSENTFVLRQAEIAWFDREAWDLLWDVSVLVDMAQHVPESTPRAAQALFTANRIANVCRLDDRATWPEGRRLAAAFLGQRNGDGQHVASAVGHAHIDSAWLWPLAETKRKCVRSFSTVLDLLGRYPDYLFACSQAQQYAWMRDEYPGLYARIREQVRAGRFVPVGGTWVEPDCNIPSGESLVRQFLLGQRFFERAFGRRCRVFWNPDVFGYSAALPQIMRGSGIRWFLTQKLSWSQFNSFPHHTFLWEGLDGSRVLTHFPPADTYNAMVTAKELVRTLHNYKDHERSRESYMLFGFGDGGGGPTDEMLERAARMKDVDGLPRLQIRAPEPFFQRLEEDLEDPCVWVGELYLELHRGTYTSQAHNKRDNRRSELLLRDAELLGAMAHADGAADYPGEALQDLWELVLLNQFHDIIPGSSINEVYRDSARHYADVLQRGRALRDTAFEALFPRNGERRNHHVLAVNTLSFDRREVVELPEGTPSSQVSASGEPLGLVGAPAVGFVCGRADAEMHPPVTVCERDDCVVLENRFVTATLARTGRLAVFHDRRLGREIVAPGEEANRLVLYEDDPVNWEAWDVDAYHLEKPLEIAEATGCRVTETGPLRVSVEFDYPLGNGSRLVQTVSLTALSPRLDFTTAAHWQESRKFLKAEFPVNVRSDYATYEIQFGHLRRPTHFNTSWDMARFEVSGHKWADLSETGFGVALLNDCKYGFGTHGNVMRLSLLRATKSPDPTADMGDHEFRYALYPHAGTPQEGGVIEEAHRFNVPLLLQPGCDVNASRSWFNVDHPSAIIDTVKKGEDSDALILRLYEAHGGRRRIRLNSALPVRRICSCNLLEDEEDVLSWDDGVELELTPFKILTLKLELEPAGA